LIREARPDVRIVVGGYDPSLATEVYEDPSWGVDFIVRGEGDITFRELVRALERGVEPAGVAGLSYRKAGTFVRNPGRAVSTLDVARFEAICRGIVDRGLHDVDYLVQGMTSSIANHGERLAPLMKAAGFRYVFLGIENILEGDLQFLRAAAKNQQRAQGRTAG